RPTSAPPVCDAAPESLRFPVPPGQGIARLPERPRPKCRGARTNAAQLDPEPHAPSRRGIVPTLQVESLPGPLSTVTGSTGTIAREHWAVEQALLNTRLQWTILRPHAFMQNWLGDVAESVGAENVIYAPIGDGRVPFIDTRDIAAVAVEVLLHPEAHVGKKYVLTGSEATGYAALA